MMESEKISGIFGSKTRYKLIKLFILNNNDSFFVREITRIINEQINSVRRELNNLTNIGLIYSKSKNNKLYYKVNKKSNLFKGLSFMFELRDEEFIKSDKKNSNNNYLINKIKNNDKFINLVNISKSVILGGVFNKKTEDPVDILSIVDDRNLKIISLGILSEIEKELDASIRFSVLTRDEQELSSGLDSDPYVTMYKDGRKIK